MPTSAISRLDRRVLVGLALIVLTITAVSAAGTESFVVTTVSPQSGQPLTEPVRWKTTVSGLAADRVEYFIDDELRWTENYEPYVFNGDEGWLTPAMVGPGRHTLKAVAYHGDETATAELVVNAPGGAPSVDLAPPPPPTSDGGSGSTSGSGTPTGGTGGSGASSGSGATSATGGNAGSGPATTPSPGTTPSPAPAPTASSSANLATGKPTKSSSDYQPAYASRYATDGNSSTRWSSSFADGQWWQVDLGSATTIGAVSVNWEDAYAAAYQVQVSSDGTAFTNVALESTDAAGVKRTSFSPVTTRYVRLLGVTRGTPYGISAWEIEVYGSAAPTTPAPTPTPTPTPAPAPATPPTSTGTISSTNNLAAGKPATASSVENETFTAAKAVDGSTSTRWGSAYANREWWQVDLGASRLVNRVSIDWEYARPTSYRIQVSSDGSAFTDVARVTLEAVGVETTSFAAVSARYVRVLGVRRATEFGISAWEIGVYGPAGPTTQSIPPVVSVPSVSALPTISGATTVGSTLVAGTGVWTNVPSSFAYTWQRCNAAGAACVAIAGGTGMNYKLVTADLGATLRVRVLASNTAGSAGATSAQTLVVTTPPPAPSGPTGASLPARLGSSSGAQYYVDGNAGSDANPGSSAAPWRSIARAWSAASAGTTINVRAGTYGGQSVFMSKTASASSPITVRAAPGETVSLGGIYVESVTGLRIQGFRISRPGGDGIKVTDSTDLEIIANDIYGNGNQGVLVVGDRSTGSSNVQLWSNRIHDNGANGSSTYNHGVYYGGGDGGTRGGVIANNVFYDQPTGYHLQIGPQAVGVIVANNTFTTATASDPTGSGIVVWGEGGQHSTRNVVIVNNAFAFNNNMGVQGSGGGSGNVVSSNLGYGNGGGDFEPYYGSSQVFTLEADNITGVDPRFANRSGHDYRPLAGSPLIDRADASYAPSTDANGAGRHGAPDIGAFEH